MDIIRPLRIGWHPMKRDGVCMDLPVDDPFVVVGAGPAGLTAGVELARAGHPLQILESDPEYVGGLARTVRYGSYRVDLGGHRFLTDNREIMDWWRRMLPDDFLEVARQSRIYYNGQFLDYPLRGPEVFLKLGPLDSLACLGSYLWRLVHPLKPERSLRDWVVNRFGDRLFHRFFESYTEKVWGIPCTELSADWAAQRIRGLSLKRAILNALGRGRRGKRNRVKTLVERFHYPRLGCGMMWEAARDRILADGGRVELDRRVETIDIEDGMVRAVHCIDSVGERYAYRCRSLISSMPLRDLVQAFRPAPPTKILESAARLSYRDFLTVILVVKRRDCFSDQWIYVHDPDVRLARVQNFKNWSATMAPDPSETVLGLEYFCFAGDDLWNMEDAKLIEMARKEVDKIGLVGSSEVSDACVIRVPKAYPVYNHGYRAEIRTIRDWLKTIPNLQSAGRNAMHQYNNQDHSMMAAMIAVQNLMGKDRRDPWMVDHAGEYVESKVLNENERVILNEPAQRR